MKFQGRLLNLGILHDFQIFEEISSGMGHIRPCGQKENPILEVFGKGSKLAFTIREIR